MDPFLGEIRIVAFSYAPKGWALCNGQLLAINQNQALFSLLGTQFGGDGRTNFALPDYRGRVPIHQNSVYPVGSNGGEEGHTLTVQEIPTHTHVANANPGTPNQTSPANGFWGVPKSTHPLPGPNYAYTAPANLVPLAPNAIGAAGGSIAHENRSPYLVVNFIIALNGIFPSRN